MEKITLRDVKKIFKGKTVAIVGSAPCVRYNDTGVIDSYDLVVRINNYKTKGVDRKNRPYDFTYNTGERCDYHYSFYGSSVRKTEEELTNDGVKAHLCKCPNEECHVTKWHLARRQRGGGDFRPLYRRREGYWDKPVYIPQKAHYMKLFELLGKHVPTTGFMCIWEILQCEPKEVYLTGFDFMESQVHNVDEKWRPGKMEDPVRHLHEKEKGLVKQWYHDTKNNITLDKHLKNQFIRKHA